MDETTARDPRTGTTLAEVSADLGTDRCAPTHPRTMSEPGTPKPLGATGSEAGPPLKAKTMSGTPPKPRTFNPPYNVRVTGDCERPVIPS